MVIEIGEGCTFTDLVLYNWHGLSLRNTIHIFMPLVRRRASEKNNPKIPQWTLNVLFWRVCGTHRILLVTETHTE